MTTMIVSVFVLGYLAIATEHRIHINKAATALFIGVVCWTLYMMSVDSITPDSSVPSWFTDKLGNHGSGGEHINREYLVEGQLFHLLAEIAQILFFLMGAMTIVELVDAHEGFALITERIKTKKQVTLLVMSRGMKGDLPEGNVLQESKHMKNLEPWHQALFLALGIGSLLSVPIFKFFTHLPPFMGMILALSATGLLGGLANWLTDTIPSNSIIALLIGLLSAVVDNVPLVAAGIEMYQMPENHSFWMMLAYCAGTGGSCLIIGSAAGVAAMGLEHINFVWYLRKIAPWALLGYLAGFLVYWIQAKLTGQL